MEGVKGNMLVVLKIIIVLTAILLVLRVYYWCFNFYMLDANIN